MSQVHAAWETLAGAQYVESEDESWLNHSGFHLSGDSEDDEVHNLTAKAYVHALNALKGASIHRQRLHQPTQQPLMLLELPVSSGAGAAESRLHPATLEPKSDSLAEAAVHLAGQGSDVPLVHNHGKAQSQSTTEGLTPSTVDAQQHTMHALEMLFPSERLTAQPALSTQRIAALKATVESKRSASQPVTTAKQSALLGADADASIPQSAQLPTQSHAAPVTFDTASPQMPAPVQQQQKLTSPASRVASEPFTGPVPHAIAQQQAGKEEQSGSQQHPSKAGTPLAVGLLQLSLSVEQIVLLQAAADNAQRYLDHDSPPDKADAGASRHTQGTDRNATVQQTARWDMQTAIVDAFKTILPSEAQPEAATPVGKSPTASSAASASAPHAPQSSRPTQASALGSKQRSQGSPEAQPSHSASVTLPEQLPVTSSTTADADAEQQAQATAPLTAQAKSASAAASSLPATAVVSQPVSNPPAGGTAEAAGLGSAAVLAAKARAAAGIVAAVKAACAADAAAASAPAVTTAAAAVERVSAPVVPAAKIATPVTQAPAAAAAGAASFASFSRNLPVPAALASFSPTAATATSTAGTGTAATAAPTAGTSPPAAAAAPFATATPVSATHVDTAAGAALPKPSALPVVFPNTASSERTTAAASTPALTAAAATLAAPLTSNSTDLASAPAAAVSAILDPFTNTQSHLPSSISEASAPIAAGGGGIQSHTLHAAPAACPAAAVKPVTCTPVSASASPGKGFVPMSLSAVSASASPGKGFVPMSLSAVSAPVSTGNSSGWARFLNAHAPLALLQGSSSSGGITPVTSLPMTQGMLNQASTARTPTTLVSPVSRVPGAASQSPAGLASSPLLPLAPPPTSWSSPGMPLSQTPSDLTPRANPAQGFSNIPTSPSLFSPAPPAAPEAAQSKRQKKRNREQAQLTQSEHSHAPSGPQASTFLPSSSKPATGSDLSPPSLTPPSKPQGTPDSEPHAKKLHQDDARPVSKELAAMRKAHGNSSIPRVGADAVSPQLMGQHVKSLVLYKHSEYNLQDICNAIGYFAVGQESEVDIFLGDLHNSHYLQQQIYSIAALFGVRIFQSQHPSRFHEKYHLTRLIQTPEAGILTVHGDTLVYFILELAELSKLNNKQGGDKYRRELKAALELANAVGRKVLGTGPNTLTRGSVLRLQQLLDKGYLAVKRPKGNKQHYKPAPYPGWRGRPRYGPPTSTSLPPSPPQLPLPPSPQPATAAKSPPKQTTPLGATAEAVLGQQVTAAAPRGDVPSHRPPSLCMNSLSPFPAPLQSATSANLSPPASKLHTASPASPMPPSQHPSAQGTMTPQAVAAAPPAVPSSVGHSEQQLSDASAALVSAVGPLFEDFVAQTEAVMSDPSTSLQGLSGSITQQLAAAIATAAVQLVETRRQKSIALLPGPPSQPSLPAAAPASVLAPLPESASAPLPAAPAATLSAAAGSMPALILPPTTASLAPTASMTVPQQLPATASVLSGMPKPALPPIPSANFPGSVVSSAAGAKAASVSVPAVAPATTAASPVATAAPPASSAASTVATAAPPATTAAPPVTTAAPPVPAALTAAAEQPALGSSNQLAAVSSQADARASGAAEPAASAAEPAASATAARPASQAAASQGGDKDVSSGTAKASVVTKFVQEQGRAKGRHEVIAWHEPDTRRDQGRDDVKAKAGTVVPKGLLKRDSSAALASDNAKKPKTAVTIARGAVESDGCVIPRLDVNKYAPTKAQGTGGSSQAAGKPSQTRVLEVPRAAAGKQGEKRVVSVSRPIARNQLKPQKASKMTAASSTSSRGSDKSSPAISGPLHASSHRQGNSNGPSQRSGSSRGVSRRSSEPPSQSGDGRFGLHSVPSRLGGVFAHSLPMMNAPLPFNPHVPMSDAQLSQSVGSLGFRPHGMMGPYSGMMPGPQAGMGNGFPSHMMPPGPSDWQGQPSGMNPFPVAGHMLPGFDNAPDFSFAN